MNTQLHRIAMCNYLGLANYEIHKKNINAIGENGHTPLDIALEYFNFEGANELLRLSANPDYFNSMTGIPTFFKFFSLSNVCSTFVTDNIEKVKNIHALDKDGKTALFYAVKEGTLDDVKLLIEKYKFDVNAKDYKRNGLLHQNGIYDSIKEYVLSSGLDDVNARNIYGESLIHYVYLPSKSVLKLFVEAGGDINAQNCDGRTILHSICDPDNVLKLIQYGADPYIEDKFGVKACDLAIKEGKKYMEYKIEETRKYYLWQENKNKK